MPDPTTPSYAGDLGCQFAALRGADVPSPRAQGGRFPLIGRRCRARAVAHARRLASLRVGWLFCPPLGQVVAGGSWPACTAQPSRVVGESPSAGLGLPPRATGVFGNRTLAVHSNPAGNRTCIARGGSARGNVSAIAEIFTMRHFVAGFRKYVLRNYFDASLTRLILGCVLLRKLFRRIPPRRNCFR